MLQKLKDRERYFKILGIILVVVFSVQSLISHRYNNYLIFENTVRNFFSQNSLYGSYPQYHEDSNHYGPLFSIFFLPFALFPVYIGLFIWNFFNAFIFFKSIKSLPFRNHSIFLLLSIPSFIACLLSEQFNPTAAALIIFSYTLLNKNNGLWSTFCIILGAYIKIYGIIGMLFFIFAKNKKSFLLYSAMWAILLFVFPMLFSSPNYILKCYNEWFTSICDKNNNNILDNINNVSILHFFKSIFLLKIDNLKYLFLTGCLIFLTPFLKISFFKDSRFQLLSLSSLLLFTVLFSTGAEDCTYIISIVGVGVWYSLTEKKKWKKGLIIMTFFFAGNLASVFFSNFAKSYTWLSSMMSVPFFLVWALTIKEKFHLNNNTVLYKDNQQ